MTFDLRGNEYEGKYYVNVAAWKIDKLGASAPAPAEADSGEPPF